MKKFIIILLVGIVLASCGTKSSREVRFRAHPMAHNDFALEGHKWTTMSHTIIVTVDSAFKPNDTVFYNRYTKCVLIERVK